MVAPLDQLFMLWSAVNRVSAPGASPCDQGHQRGGDDQGGGHHLSPASRWAQAHHRGSNPPGGRWPAHHLRWHQSPQERFAATLRTVNRFHVRGSRLELLRDETVVASFRARN